MPHFFANFPTIRYDVLNQGAPKIIQNPFVRFKFHDIVQSKVAVYYTHDVEDGERADVIASKYYDDETLDWVIWLSNLTVDPHFDWPMDQQSFNEYIKKKYGSVSDAQADIHAYQCIIREHSVLSDGTIVKQKTLDVDLTTYSSLSATQKQIKYSYEYELELNDARRIIKVLKKDYVPSLLREVETIFS